MTGRERSRRSVIIVLQSAVTIVLGAFIVATVDLHAVRSILGAAQTSLIVTSCAVLLTRVPLSAWRWKLLLAHYGHHFGTATLTRTILASQFFGTILPGATALDLVRGYYLSQRNVPPVQVAATVVAERVASVMSLLLLAAPAGATLAWARWGAPEVWGLVLVMVAAVAVFALWQMLADRLGRLAWARAPRLAGFAAQLPRVWRDRRLLGRVLALSLAFQIAGLLSVYVVGLAVGAQSRFVDYLLFVPLVWLGTTLPVSINGLGVREGAFVFFFGLVGMPAATALAISVIVSVQSVVIGLAGVVTLPFARGLRTPPSPAL